MASKIEGFREGLVSGTLEIPGAGFPHLRFESDD